MSNIDHIPKTYEDAIEALARWQAEDQKPLIDIFSFPDPAKKVVRLVEVSDEFPESNEVQPTEIGMSAEFPWASSVILATPQEWSNINSGKLRLPDGWKLDEHTQVWPVQ